VNWYRFSDDYANADHADCASTPAGDIVQLARQVDSTLASGLEASSVADGWSSYPENEVTFAYDAGSFTISSAGTDMWQNLNRCGVLYKRGALRDGGSATMRVGSMFSEGNRPWAWPA
jgi:hypothetical protein